jgi:PAS domain S-box-containing protein
MFLPAVLASAWFCGAGAGLLVVVIGFVLGSWFFGPPRLSLALTNQADQFAAFIYLTTGLAMVVLARYGPGRRSRATSGMMASKAALDFVRTSHQAFRRGKASITLVFMAAIAVLCASLIFVFQAGQVSFLAIQKMTDERQVLERLEGALFTLTEAETSQRGYLLTGTESYLGEYRKATKEMERKIAELGVLGTNGVLPRARVERVAEFAAEKSAALQEGIRIRNESGLGAAVSLVQSGMGKQAMDDLRVELDQLRIGAQAEFAEAARRAHRARAVRTVLYVMAGLVDLGFLGWAAQKIASQIDEVSRGKEVLATTVASIADGILVTDGCGRVVFMNREAERLTGCQSQECVGHVLGRVFRIVNERTRQQEESPVDKALRLGSGAGLANHTVLLRRDGTEIPIDATAAPIRQPNCAFFGAVLVFRDFSSQKQVEEKLERTVQERTSKLREMVAELEHLSYAIVHDMRAPLRAMQGFAELLEEEVALAGSQERMGYVRRIRTAANRLDLLIKDALNYNRAVLQEMPLTPVDLSTLLRGLIETYPNLDTASGSLQVSEQCN